VSLTTAKWVGGLAHWRDEQTRTAFLSIAFTWKINEAKRLAEYYAGLGYRVKAGGVALAQEIFWSDFRPYAEIELRTTSEGKVLGDGFLPDAVYHHSPLATTASRGCPVDCWFCVVPFVEGTEFTFLPDFEPRPILTDNNLSALPADYQQHIVDRYVAAGVELRDANSGFEPKTFDRDVYERWAPINKGPWRFALDEKGELDEASRAIAMLRSNGVGSKRIQVYAMIGHEPFAECMERIQRIISLGGEPYVQPVMKLNARQKKPWVRHDWITAPAPRGSAACTRHPRARTSPSSSSVRLLRNALRSFLAIGPSGSAALIERLRSESVTPSSIEPSSAFSSASLSRTCAPPARRRARWRGRSGSRPSTWPLALEPVVGDAPRLVVGDLAGVPAVDDACDPRLGIAAARLAEQPVVLVLQAEGLEEVAPLVADEPRREQVGKSFLPLIVSKGIVNSGDSAVPSLLIVALGGASRTSYQGPRPSS
jgi:hypothetical protein